MPLNADVFSGAGGAVDALFGAIGSFKAAEGYKKAAQIAAQNAALSKESTAIQQTQAARQIYQTIGGQEADVAGAGFSASGSALDLLRSSAQQGALQRQLIGAQGLINENSYTAQAAAYSAQAAASKSSGIGGIFKTALSIGSTLMAFSDETLKRDVTPIGPSHIPGIGLYLFRYGSDPAIYKGVLAQEVALARPDAVRDIDGILAVDYGALGLTLEEVH